MQAQQVSGDWTTACDPHALSGDQCGKQRGPDLKHSATTVQHLWKRSRGGTQSPALLVCVRSGTSQYYSGKSV